MKELPAIVKALLADPGPGAVLATLAATAGSSYRRPGARLLMLAGGRRVGSISGGCLEEDVIARAARVRDTGIAEAVVYDTTAENDLVWGVGLGCHGIVRVLIERLPPQPGWAAALARNFAARRPSALAVIHGGEDPASWGTRLAAPGDCADPERLFAETIAPPTLLVIFGAGDDAQPLARLGHELGWQIIVADPRGPFATEVRFPAARRLVVGAAETLVQTVSPDPASIAVVMTHHYVHDRPILRDLLPRPLAYLGLLGPRQRAEKILADLTADGCEITAGMRARLRAPVGLDLGADGPEQVALAIVAEIQSVLAGRDARPLRERTRPIHD